MRKLFAIDSDWITTTLTFVSLPFFTLIAVILIWNTVTGRWSISRPSWLTILLVLYGIVILVSTSERLFEFAIGLFLVHPILELILWPFKASIQSYRIIGLIGRSADIVLCIGLIVADILWFKAKIRITQSSD